MQRIDTCFNNINVSFCIDVKDQIIKRKEKSMRLYSEEVKQVIRHLLKVISGSKDNDMFLFNKITEILCCKSLKTTHEELFSVLSLQTIDYYFEVVLTPTHLLQSNTSIMDIICAIIARLFSPLLKNEAFRKPNDLFMRLQLIKQHNAYSSNDVNAIMDNSIEQLSKFSTAKSKPQPIYEEKLFVLQSYFINAKRIIIEVPEDINDTSFYQYIYILLNQKWLASNCLEMRLDLHKCTLALSKGKAKRATVILLLSLMFFMLKINVKAILRLSFNIPYAYTPEIKHYFESIKGDKLPPSFHLLEFLNTKIAKMKQLTIAFNAIDSLTFQTIISVINNNDHIETLSLSLFPSDSSLSFLFSVKHLSDFCSIQNIKLEKENGMYSEDYNETDSILSKLFKTFQFNLELFVYSLSLNQSALTELKVCFELPYVLLLSEKYIEVLLHFFFKLMLYVESSINNITSLEIKAANFPFDADRFINVEEELSKLNMSNNQIVKYAVFDFKICNLESLHLMIPSRVRDLVLGEIDNDSIESFSKNVLLLKELVCLTFTFCSYNQFDIEGNSETIEEFIGNFKESQLKFLTVVFKVHLSVMMIKKMMQMISDDYGKEYQFTFYRSVIREVGLAGLFEEEIRFLSTGNYWRIQRMYLIIFAFKTIYNKKAKDKGNYFAAFPLKIQHIFKRIYLFHRKANIKADFV